VDRAYEAHLRVRSFTQEQVDAIVESMAAAARAQARPLAEMAVEETGMGTVESKVAKNLLCADLLPRYIRGMKTVGVIRTAREEGIIEIAEPVGVVAAILPTTNPTSTAIYKSIISLKSGNAVVLTPHPRAKRCTCATIDLLLQAALRSGAPEGIIQCINHPTLEATNALMRHPKTGVILSTGGGGIVKAWARATCRCWWTSRPTCAMRCARWWPANRSTTARSVPVSRPLSPFARCGNGFFPN
jgi:acyl-CoA reductase-like NAD-dependent aldehyde dehydrogenase